MSKLQDRLPALATPQERLEVATSVLDQVIGEDGRVQKADLVQAIQDRIDTLPINEDLVVREGRKGIADQLASGWANQVTIKLDRKQRAPVYQTSLGFEGSFFKVGSTFVRPDSMTVQDFEVMLERIDRRIEGAQTDRSILAEFFDRARPGLEAGENLVQQFDAGTLNLVSVNGHAELESGEETEEQ